MNAPAPNPFQTHRLVRAVRWVVLVPLARLRFLFILGAIGVVIVKWDDLVARYEKYMPRPGAESIADPDHEFYCPMHPTIVRDTNKDKCPICFMPLSKRKKGEVTDDPLPAGTVSRVQLSPYRVVLAGVRTVPIEYQTLTKDITTVGTVEFDERKLKTVPTRVKGRIEKLFVNQTGQMVHKNDPLAELYSPDLIVTVQNLLDARMANNPSLEKNARDRLRLWGIDDAQVDEIAKTGKPITNLTIRSPITGHVLRKSVREGQYIEEGGTLFDVADLSTVWIEAQLYEDDLAFLPPGGHDPKTGQPGFDLPITATARAFPGKVFDGRLSFLFPHVDAETRTLTVRFELPNDDHELRPGMSATATLHMSPELLSTTPAGAKLQLRGGKILAVPESAVIDTGSMKVVYREGLPNTFEGVAVRLGSKMRDGDGVVYYPLLAGLNEGDRIVTAGSFLIDAETRLNPAAGSIFIGGGGVTERKGPAATIRPTTPDDEAEKVAAAMAKLSPENRKLAQAQRFCPIRHEPLGAMGVPVRITLDDKPVFVCCKACIAEAQADPAKTLLQVEEYKRKGSGPPPPLSKPPGLKLTAEDIADIRAGLAELPSAERKVAEAQRLCPVLGKPLGIMGKPFKADLDAKRSIYVCCRSCIEKAKKDPEATLRKVEESRALAPIHPEGKP
jgi:Cu(I)/Ag(I) efflux system membrane fusion protein